MEKEQDSLTLYKFKKEFILLKKTEPRGQSGLEQNESLRAYPCVLKTINHSHCLLSQFQEEEKIQKGEVWLCTK